MSAATRHIANATNAILEGGPRDGEVVAVPCAGRPPDRAGPLPEVKFNFLPKPVPARGFGGTVSPNIEYASHIYHHSHFDVQEQRHVYQYRGVEKVR